MLIVVPPSETKQRPPASGVPVDLGSLSFPELTEPRAAILDALIETSKGLDAFSRLQVRPSLVADVARNTHLRDVPALPALEVYTGPLHEGLDAATLSTAAARRAATQLVVASSLWGLLRPGDRIPPYRLHICSRLLGMDRLEPVWRAVVPDVLGAAAGDAGVVVDLRSPGYQAIGMPAIDGDRVVSVSVAQRGESGRTLGDVVTKRVRGKAARHLLESGEDPEDAHAVAAILGECWPVSLERGTGRRWALRLFVGD